MNKTDLSIIRILAMGNLLESYSTIQAELRYVNECNLNNQLKISDADAVKSLMKELNINDEDIKFLSSILSKGPTSFLFGNDMLFVYNF